MNYVMGKQHDCPQCGQDMRLPPMTHPHSCLTDPRVVELVEAAKESLKHWTACLAEQERALGEKDMCQRRRIVILRTALAAFKGEKFDMNKPNPQTIIELDEKGGVMARDVIRESQVKLTCDKCNAEVELLIQVQINQFGTFSIEEWCRKCVIETDK